MLSNQTRLAGFQKAEVVIGSRGMLCATHAADEAARLAFSRKRSSLLFPWRQKQTNRHFNITSQNSGVASLCNHTLPRTV